jgi:hypothetical protein
MGGPDVCTSLRKSVLDKQNANKGPGPGAYEPPSSVGQQNDSNKETAPSAKMGTSIRSNLIQKNVPGPGAYASNSSVGPQVSSQKQSSPRAAFSTAKAPKDDFAKVPGAGTYQQDTDFGRASATSARSGHTVAPKFSFSGGGKRSDMKGKAWVPGPGQYNDIDPAISSRKSAAPRYTMTGRWKNNKVGVKTPGPGTYRLTGAYGQQQESNRSSAPMSSFGTEKRKGMGKRNGTPGEIHILLKVLLLQTNIADHGCTGPPGQVRL